MSMVAIGLPKPQAKTKVGESCTCKMFIEPENVEDNMIKIPGIYFQDQNTEQGSNNSRIMMETIIE